MPKISIIIPTFEHGDTIEVCLLSLFNQTFKDYEIIVVNDGSTDNTQKILEKYKDKIKIITQENKGAPAARNRGFRESSGEFIIFCDADVTARPDMLQKMFGALLEHPEYSYAYSSFKWGWKKFKLHEFNTEKLKRGNFITSTSLVRREHFPAAGWDESLKKFQDWDLWLTMLKEGHIGYWIPEYLFSVKPRRNGISSWLPSFFHKIPWGKIGWVPKEIVKYNNALEVIKKKHASPTKQ
jgi:glycosyltransferase involved in cell wall biosynthesis